MLGKVMIMGSCSMNRLNGRNIYVHKLRMGRDTKTSEYCANKTFFSAVTNWILKTNSCWTRLPWSRMLPREGIAWSTTIGGLKRPMKKQTWTHLLLAVANMPTLPVHWTYKMRENVGHCRSFLEWTLVLHDMFATFSSCSSATAV